MRPTVRTGLPSVTQGSRQRHLASATTGPLEAHARRQRAFGRFGTTKTSKVGSWRTRDDITIYAATVRLREE